MTRLAAPALVTLLLGITALTGCGDDEDVSIDGAVRDATAESSDGGVGTAGRRANAGGASGTGGRRAAPSAGDGGRSGGSAGVAGSNTAAGGTGGRRAADSGTAGRVADSVKPSTDENDEQGCPSLNFGGLLVLPSCCTPRDMCGVETSTVGGPGCLDLATAADRARIAGASVVFPAPRACKAEASDADAGVGVETPDDAGSL